MPLIRYRTGDVGRRNDGPCGCGRGLSCMEIVGGRHTDHLVAADGTLMHGLSVIYILREIDSVERFQIHQHADRTVVVRIVPTPEFDDQDRSNIERAVRRQLGHRIEVQIRLVDRIEPAGSGKFRYVTSQAAESRGSPRPASSGGKRCIRC